MLSLQPMGFSCAPTDMLVGRWVLAVASRVSVGPGVAPLPPCILDMGAVVALHAWGSVGVVAVRLAPHCGCQGRVVHVVELCCWELESADLRGRERFLVSLGGLESSSCDLRW